VFVCQLLWYLLESLTRSAATIVDGLKWYGGFLK
jgi:hypothetical protein